MWAFCKAVLAGAGRSNGLSVKLCWRELCRNNSTACGFSVSLSLSGLGFCEAVLVGSHLGFL